MQGDEEARAKAEAEELLAAMETYNPIVRASCVALPSLTHADAVGYLNPALARSLMPSPSTSSASRATSVPTRESLAWLRLRRTNLSLTLQTTL